MWSKKIAKWIIYPRKTMLISNGSTKAQPRPPYREIINIYSGMGNKFNNLIDREKGELTVVCKDGRRFVVYFDELDHDFIAGRTWYIEPHGASGYAKTWIIIGGKGRGASLHRLLTNPALGLQVDHKDGNRLNNRRENLRVCTCRENSGNAKLNARNTTGFRGVSFRKRDDIYIVQIRTKEKTMHGGSFKNPIDAAIRYNELAIEQFGEFARLNVIPSSPLPLSDKK
jgi:hypothetical protein